MNNNKVNGYQNTVTNNIITEEDKSNAYDKEMKLSIELEKIRIRVIIIRFQGELNRITSKVV